MRLCLEALYLQLSCRGILDEKYRVNGKLVKANRSLGGNWRQHGRTQGKGRESE